MKIENMKTSKLSLFLIGGIAALGIAIYAYNTMQQEESTNQEKDIDYSSLIVSFLNKVIDTQYANYLSYQFYLLAVDKDFKKGQMDQLWEKYGKFLAPPVIDWPSLIHQLDNEGVGFLQNTITQYIVDRGYTVTSESKEYSDLFDAYLIDTAQKDAQEKIKEFI